MHVGDDVYIMAESYGQAFDVLRCCKAAGLAMNPVKQSVGSYTAEFLRVAYTSTCAYSYLCRSISACICGNWASEFRLSREEGMRSLLSHSWTLNNRSNSRELSQMLYLTTKRMARVGGRLADKLLDGETSFGNGPCRYRDAHASTCEIKYKRRPWEKEMDVALDTLASMATADYLGEHAHPIEIFGLKLVDGDITTPMMRASYGKTIAGWYRPETVDEIKSVRVYKKEVKGYIDIDSAWNRRRKKGVLEGYPLLNLIKGGIKGEVLRDLVNVAGGDATLNGQELFEHAWGESMQGCAVRGRMSFSDASAISRKIGNVLVDTYYSFYV
jgi:hypothetical protein